MSKVIRRLILAATAAVVPEYHLGHPRRLRWAEVCGHVNQKFHWQNKHASKTPGKSGVPSIRTGACKSGLGSATLNFHLKSVKDNLVKRRLFIQSSVALTAALTAFSPVHAKAAVYPTKPIRLIASSSAGGMPDLVARLYAERLSKSLKQPVVVENMPGASSMLASRYVARAAPDGYTLLVAANTIVTMPHLIKSAGYEIKDFIGIADLARAPSMLVVSGSSPIKSIPELVAAAKKSPGTIPYAFSGHGTTSHLTAELFATSAGIRFSPIAYKGISLASPDLIAGRVAFMMGPSTSLAELIKSGKIRALAITSNSRSPAFPDVPTFRELGYPDATYSIFSGILAPAGTPNAIQNILADAIEAAKKDPVLLERLKSLGHEISDVRTPDRFKAFLLQEEEKSQKLFKEASIMVE